MAEMFPTPPPLQTQASPYPPNVPQNPAFFPPGAAMPPPNGIAPQGMGPLGGVPYGGPPPQGLAPGGVSYAAPPPQGMPPAGPPYPAPQSQGNPPAVLEEGPAPEPIPKDQYQKSEYQHTGKKKALLIGINYFKTPNELKGCLNDVKNIKEFLLERGFKDEPGSMVVLTDDNPDKLPLKSNIISACKWLVDDAQPGDSLFFHYSGHGEQVPDKKILDGDEVDGLDEVILPLDFKKNGYIVDDELHKMLVQPLQKGVRLTAVFDSCHSGTALDLPYIFKTDGTYHEVGLSIKYIPKTLTEAGVEALHGDTAAAKKKLVDMGKVILTAPKKAKKLKKTNSSPAEVLMFSGCKDEQNAADTAVQGQAEALVSTGLMSYALITSIRKNPKMSLIDLVNSMREIIRERGDSQKPQLSTSHPIDPNTIFEI